MKNTYLTLLFCFGILASTLQAQVPDSLLQLAAEYTTLLRKRDFVSAADYLHPCTEYALEREAWIKAQESTVNQDMSMQTVNLSADKAKVTTYQVAGQDYYLFTMAEEIKLELTNENLSGEPEVTGEIMADFAQQYGKNQVRQIDAQQFIIARNHSLLMLPLEEDGTQWRIINFPDGRLDLAYGLLPAAVWRAFFPGQGLTDRMRYDQAVAQAVGRYFQLLKAKQYDAAAAFTIKQENPTARFMKWYKSLDNETTVLHYADYRLTTPVRMKFHDGKRYAGFGLQITMIVGFTAKEATEKDISETKELLEEVYPNAEIRYDETNQQFTLDVFSPTIGVADASKNNWMLLMEDRANGMSIKDNIAEEVQQGAGLN